MSIEASRSKLPVIAIIGRPNIGKSSLFNVILRKRVAIVHEQAGVTRDRVSLPTEHNGKPFMLVDTGGLGVGRKQRKNVDFFDSAIRDQLEVTLEDADAVILMTDAQEGLTQQDREVAEALRAKGKLAVVACNKADNQDYIDNAQSFNQLGFDSVTAISCQHKTGFREMLDAVVEFIPEVTVDSEEEPSLSVCLAGRPNVGKSSIANRLLGEDRVIVSDVAGTTRDAVDIPFTFEEDGVTAHGVLVDTAGVKKQNKVDNLVEMFSMMRTEEAIKRAGLVLFVLDISTGVTAHDKKIASLIQEAGKPCIMLANKADLVKGKKRSELMEDIERELPFMMYASVVFTSAETGTAFDQILPRLLLLRDDASMSVPTALLNQVLQDVTMRTPPPSTGKGFFKIYYATMVSTPPAHFVIFCNKKNYLQPSYLRFLEKQLRRSFGFNGVPIEIELRERSHIQDKFSGGILSGEAKAKMEAKRRSDRRRNRDYRKKKKR